MANDILQEWLDKGNDDIRSAEYLTTMHHPTPDDIICYLCQQSAEKYLKAFIFYNNIDPEKTHDLEELLEVCKKYNAEFSILITKVSNLTRYAITPRYPNLLDITKDDVKIAIGQAKSVQEFVLKVFNDIEEEALKKNEQPQA